MNIPKKSPISVAPLLLVLFIDGMGLSLLFPLLNNIIIDRHSDFLPLAMTLDSRQLLYGFMVGIFMICWFFGAAIFGDLSDSIGRKKSLLICLLGAFFGYFLSAIAVSAHSIFFLIMGRVIAGFTAGSQPIAQAAIVDVSQEKDKARNLSLVLLSLSLGFIMGPLIGGVLSEPKLVGWFNFSTPFYFASLISLLNVAMLLFLFQETFSKPEKSRIRISRAATLFISAFKHKKIRWLSLVLLTMTYGWSNFFTFISIFAFKVYQFSPFQISLSLADMGIGFSLGCGYLVDYCVKRFRMKWIVVWSYFITAILILFLILLRHSLYLWLLMAFVGAAISVGYSVLIVLFSNQVSAKEQGWVMGVTGAVMALCFGLTSLMTGYLANYSVNTPLYFSVGGMIISAVIMLFVRPSSTS